jgi:hypothetical protein
LKKPVNYPDAKSDNESIVKMRQALTAKNNGVLANKDAYKLQLAEQANKVNQERMEMLMHRMPQLRKIK